MPRKKIHTFTVSHLQILDEEGRADPQLDPQLPDDQMVKLYRAMLLARSVDQRMLKLQRQGRIGTFGPNTGQEAAHVGPAFAMEPQDWFVGAFRELGARLLRGEPVVNGFLFHNGFEEGNVIDDNRGNLLPISIIVSAQTLHAVGIAHALRYRGITDAAVVTVLGDGGTSQGDFYEAMNFAGVWKAPVVFVCQNNQWAISLPRSKQTAAPTLAQKAIAAGITGIQVDGNDVLATYVAAKEALARARAGEGPTLIEALTYRLMMHTTADDPRKYRSEKEEQEAWRRDPLPRLRKYLEGRGIWNEERQTALEAEIKAEEDAAVAEFERRTEFKPDAPFDHVFGTRHAGIEAQRAEFLEELERSARPAHA
jgi:pyruvate dehydrogenase E1 component alpha subunit